MANDKVGAVSHVSLGTNQFTQAKAFYDVVLGALGMRCVMGYPGGAAFGYSQPEFWIQRPYDRARAGVGNGTHVCFNAESAEAVRAFHAAALLNGGTDDGPPGYRTLYSPSYYAAFVRDPDGNKIEALFWEASAG